MKQIRYCGRKEHRRRLGITRREWRYLKKEEYDKEGADVEPKLCARAGCGKMLVPGTPPYRIQGKEEEYCSRECVDAVLYADRKRPLRRTRMEVPAEDFGPAGIVRHVCDREGCGQPVLIRWASKDGKKECCSNECLKIMEEEGEDMAEETTKTDKADSPIRAGGKTTTKKATGKTEGKKATAKKPVAVKAKSKKADPKKTVTARTGKKKQRKTGTESSNGSVSAEIIALMRRAKGATMDEIIKITGWQRHSVRGFVSGTLNKKMGLKVKSFRSEEGDRTYQLPA